MAVDVRLVRGRINVVANVHAPPQRADTSAAGYVGLVYQDAFRIATRWAGAERNLA